MKNYMKNIVFFQYWSLSYESLDLKIALPEDGIRRFIEEKLLLAGDLSCFDLASIRGDMRQCSVILAMIEWCRSDTLYSKPIAAMVFLVCIYIYYLGCEY